MDAFKRYTLSNEEFNKLRALVLNFSGISLSDSKRELVLSRFSRRLRALNLNSFNEYYNLLISSQGMKEIQKFINTITTNKTDFFREKHHFDFLQTVFAEENKHRKDTIKIWSAACSTGQEPYTIAMVLHKYLVEQYGVEVKILATDIDTNVLDFAKKGVYEQSIIDPVPMDMLKKYFLRGKDDMAGFYKVKPVLKNMIEFKQLNFIEKDYHITDKFDIVFCRNAIIYFNSDTKKYVVNKLKSYIKNDGYFIVGHSESLFNFVDGLTYLKNTIYKKDF